MLISVYVPLMVTVVLAVAVPWAAPRLAPRPAAWFLACAAPVTALGWLGSLALLAFAGLVRLPEVAAEGQWSVAAVRAADPVSLTVAMAAAVTLPASVAGLAVAAVRQTRQLRWARRECRRLPGGTELAVLDQESPDAFALPGTPGRIVVSRGMLRCLDGREREALLAHERAHLRGRHHRFQTVWRLSAAVNPLLRPLAGAGGFALERWADEEAAARVGDRVVVAHAVGRAALAASANRSRSVLAMTGGAVPRRVRALLGPPPPRRRLPFVAGAALLLVCCGSLTHAAFDSEQMIDTAHHATHERAEASAARAPLMPTRAPVPASTPAPAPPGMPGHGPRPELLRTAADLREELAEPS
ncbi:M56 family metallopeptidase [Streptomyces sp. NPDC005423]|uniref:M56 family metallopeptidase n=1 Tax=Streptomyces sp. NPDC005423 TaxID=3155343 RepID=UPI0033B86E1C